MKYNPDIHHRRSVRLKGYDYSLAGVYFITICALNKECLFGRIADDGRGTKFCAPTDAGKIAGQCWREIPTHYPNVLLDEFIVMPNHVHGLIAIENNKSISVSVGVQNFEPLQIEPPQIEKVNQFQKIIPQSIGAIIRGYKIGVTKWMRSNTNIYQVWQRNYYEHVVRNDRELNSIREYINYNPANWKTDDEFKEQKTGLCLL